MNFGLREHFVTIFRHWGKICLIVLGALAVTGSIAFLSSKVYVSESRVLILTRSPAARATQTKVTEEERGSSPQDQARTQVAILQSPIVAYRLAQELGPQRVLSEMRWKWDWVRELPAKWRKQILTALHDNELTAELMQTLGIKRPPSGPGGPPVLAAAEKLLGNLKADAIIKTDIFAASFSAPSAPFAREALDGFLKLYIEHVVNLRRPARTAEIAQFEADRLQVELREAEERLRFYAEENSILSIDRQKNLLLDRLSRTQEDLTNARRASLETEQKLATIQLRIDQLPREEAVSETTRPNPLFDSLRERLSRLETDQRQFVPGSQAANRIQVEIDGIRQQLATEQQTVSGSRSIGASNLYQQLQGTLAQEQAEQKAQEVRVSFIQRQMQSVESELRRLDEHEMQYRERQRMVQAKEDAFRFALQKREETAIAEQLKEGSLAQVVQVEPASEPEKAAAPRRMRLLLLGIIVGTFAGIAMSYAFEFGRRVMSTAREAEIAMGLPALVTQFRTGLFRRRGRTNKTEMRRFAATLLHDAVKGKTETLMFASTDRYSGQTTIVTDVASALSEQGARVLTVRQILANRVSGGVSLAVADAAGTALDGPPSGNGPRNDLAQMKGKASMMRDCLADLLRERGRAYDFVFVDAPNLARFPEQLYQTSLIDAVIPVMEADRTKSAELRDMLQQFEDVDAKLLGMAISKQSRNRASWAFCWISMMRRRSYENAA